MSGLANKREITADAIGSVSDKALENFIYILGTARGGTSILRDALGIHDEILVLPNMTHFMNQLWRYRNKVHGRLLRQILRLPRFYREMKVFADLEEGRSLSLQNHIRTALNSGDLKRMWQIYPLVYGLDQQNKKDLTGICAWADKANDFYRVGSVVRSFPQGKFIFLLRDPRGAVSSLAKKTVVKEKFSFNAPIENSKVIDASITWRRMTQRALFFAKRNAGRSLLVKLEDFLMSPAATMNNVFSFCIGKSVPEYIIMDRLGGMRYRTSHSPTDSGKGLSREPIDRWKKLLSSEQETIIRTLTAKTACKAGYRFEDGGASTSTFLEMMQMMPSVRQKLRTLVKMAYLGGFESLI